MKKYAFIIVLLPLILFYAFGMNEESLTPEKTLEMMILDEDDIVIIDVRTKMEYEEGHIPGSLNMPYNEIDKLIKDISKDSQLVLYCRSGRRSGIANEVLTDLGYKNILDYKRFSDWAGEVEYSETISK